MSAAINDLGMDPRRKAIIDLMANSLKPKPDPSNMVLLPDNPQPSNVGVPDNWHPPMSASPDVPKAPVLPDSRGALEQSPDAPSLPGSTPPAPVPVRIGVGTKGIIGLDKTMSDLDTRREANITYGSDINTHDPDFTEINPPKGPQKPGFGERLKHLGRDFIVQAGEYQKTHPNATGAELLAAGATGGGISAASPNTGDAMFRGAQIKQSEQDVARQLGLEKEKAQIGALDQRGTLAPIYRTRTDEDGNVIRQQVDRRTGTSVDVIGPDGKPVYEKRAPKKVKYGDYSVSEDEAARLKQAKTMHDESATEQKLRDAERQAKEARTESDKSAAAQTFNDIADKHVKELNEEKDQLWKDAQDLPKEVQGPGAFVHMIPNPELKAKMDRFHTVSDKIKDLEGRRKAIPSATAPVGSPPMVAPPNAKGRKWSKAAFAKAHPGVDVNAAAKTMSDAGADVVE